MKLKIFLFSSLLLPSISASANNLSRVDTKPMSLQQVVANAQNNDPWLDASKLRQSAIEARSTAQSTYDDPRVSIGLSNLPVDGFDFSQEPMTQFKVGISQMLPRGDSLSITEQKLRIEASKHPMMRLNRLAQVEQEVTQLWLDVFLAQTIIHLIEKDKVLFEQMIDITKSSYASAIGNTTQQDIIRAQLALARLDDRLVVQEQKLAQARSLLMRWLYEPSKSASFIEGELTVTSRLPEIRLRNASVMSQSSLNYPQVIEILRLHPAMQIIDVAKKVAQKEVELAKQSYEPQWGVNASYAYRDDDPTGISRADFFSVGVTFDLPLFTENKQDKSLSASVAEKEALNTDKLLLLRNMLSQVEKEHSTLQRLFKRQKLYQEQLMDQTHQQAEAALTAYTNDNGAFTEVIGASIAQLNTNIAKVEIDVEALKTVTRLNYFFVQANSLSASSTSMEH